MGRTSFNSDAKLCCDLSYFLSLVCDGFVFMPELRLLRFNYRYFNGSRFQGFYMNVFFYFRLFFDEVS
jgi:hypothetical protein